MFLMKWREIFKIVWQLQKTSCVNPNYYQVVVLLKWKLAQDYWKEPTK